MDEERGSVQVGEMLGTLLLGLARGMQRVREQEQARDQVGLGLTQFGGEHAGLAAAIGVTAEEELPGLVRINIPTSPNTGEKWGTQVCFKRGDGVSESLTVAGGVAVAGWAEGSDLAEGEISSGGR